MTVELKTKYMFPRKLSSSKSILMYGSLKTNDPGIILSFQNLRYPQYNSATGGNLSDH